MLYVIAQCLLTALVRLALLVRFCQTTVAFVLRCRVTAEYRGGFVV